MRKFKYRWQLTEAVFEAFYPDKYPGTFVYRFPDFADLNFKRGRRTNVTGMQSAAEQPSDYLITLSTVGTFFAEVKATKSKTSFSYSDISGSQLRAATKQVKAGGDYFFIIEAYEIREWFMVSAEYILRSRKQGNKSVKFKDIQGCRWHEIEEYFSTLTFD